MPQSDYGDPDWQRAHGVLERLMWLPSDVPEAEIVVRLHHVMGYLFPGIEYPGYAVERQSGNGRMDLRCRRVVFEIKSFRKLEGVNWQGREGKEFEDQLLRYLQGRLVTNTAGGQQTLVPDFSAGWRGVVTDGVSWSFYDYDHQKRSLRLVGRHRVFSTDQIDDLLRYLHGFVSASGPFG